MVKEDLSCGSFWRHFVATLVKRIRVIRRDLRSFLFELILPVIIILLALILMQISFVNDHPEREYSIDFLNNDSSPVTFGIGSSDATLLNTMET